MNSSNQTSTEDVLKRLRHLVEDGLDQRDGNLEWAAREAIKEIRRLENGLNIIANARKLIKRKSSGEKWCVSVAERTLNGEVLK